MFPPTHPVTRLNRVVQQLTSFADLHAAELDSLALEIDAASPELGQRLRAFRALQRDEGQIAIEELIAIRDELGAVSDHVEAEPTILTSDPAVDSPKRAKWIAAQAARDEQLRRPRSRRQLLGGVPKPPPSAPTRPET